jgi:hypothetical protein
LSYVGKETTATRREWEPIFRHASFAPADAECRRIPLVAATSVVILAVHSQKRDILFPVSENELTLNGAVPG